MTARDSAPQLATSWLRLWHIDLDLEGERLDAVDTRERLLSEIEREAQFSPNALAPGRERSIRRRRARIALRMLLFREGVAAARGTPMSLGPHGKPTLPSTSGTLDFSISYSGSRCLLAIGTPGPLGVDLERPRDVAINARRRALIIAAGRALAPQDPLGRDEETAFVAAWTRLEALAKARGDGIGKVLEALDITARGAATSSTSNAASRATDLMARSALGVVDVEVPAPGIAALAAPSTALAARSRCTPLDVRA